MADAKKNSKMTVFRTDRHEDCAAMVLVACIVAFVLVYMAFLKPNVAVSASLDGKLVSVAVEAGADVKQGDLVYIVEYTEKRYVEGEVQERLAQRKVLAKASGKVLEVKVKPGDALKKDKTTIIVLAHNRGTLP